MSKGVFTTAVYSSRNARYQADYGCLYMSRIVVAIGQETSVDDETQQLIVSVSTRGESVRIDQCLLLAVDLCKIRFNTPGRPIGECCRRIAQQAFQVSLQTGKTSCDNDFDLLILPSGSVLARTLGDSTDIDI